MWAITRVISRRVHGTSFITIPKLSGFSIVSPKQVEVEYADGTKFNFSSEFLRIHSPAADGKVRSIGGEKVISGRRYVGIMSAEPVGNYGVRYLQILQGHYELAIMKIQIPKFIVLLIT
ncbi:Myb domain protein [Arabidopsis thaliana]|jgi:hypothetical protein|uniref:Myb domain protein n=1 Tax=Arabidopsis thaliana TaxID=3702 RepID=A0A1I9LMJ3_ARATH|nr:Myb domain protein [Arabidopsis thaliana]ANM63801.1 Myb domain protein [Arabidopsis thaliana]|eukprot:NP_001325872.1 Myb domain protein [Arabidopsis thaliana]